MENCDSCDINETTFTFPILQCTNDSLAFERATVLVHPKQYNKMVRYANLITMGEPNNLDEALRIFFWKNAMDNEYSALIENKTWPLVLTQQNVIDFKWVYKIKHRDDDSIVRYKARLVSKVLLENRSSVAHQIIILWRISNTPLLSRH
jgi:hypothetical protein